MKAINRHFAAAVLGATSLLFSACDEKKHETTPGGGAAIVPVFVTPVLLSGCTRDSHRLSLLFQTTLEMAEGQKAPSRNEALQLVEARKKLEAVLNNSQEFKEYASSVVTKADPDVPEGEAAKILNPSLTALGIVAIPQALEAYLEDAKKILGQDRIEQARVKLVESLASQEDDPHCRLI